MFNTPLTPQKLYLYALLSLLVSISFTFECNDVPMSLCSKMEGCSYRGGKCQGIPESDCDDDEQCYYVFPSGSQEKRNGSIESPFETIYQALNASNTNSENKVKIFLVTFDNTTIFPLNFNKKVQVQKFQINSFFKTTKGIIQINSTHNNFGLDIKAQNIKFENIIFENTRKVNQLLHVLPINSEENSIASFSSCVINWNSDSSPNLKTIDSYTNLTFKNTKINSDNFVIQNSKTIKIDSLFMKGINKRDIEAPLIKANYIDGEDLIVQNYHSKNLESSFEESNYLIEAQHIYLFLCGFSNISSNTLIHANQSFKLESSLFQDLYSGIVIQIENGDDQNKTIFDTKFSNITVMITTIYSLDDHLIFYSSIMDKIYQTYRLPDAKNSLLNNNDGIGILSKGKLNVLFSIFSHFNSSCINVINKKLESSEFHLFGSTIFSNQNFHPNKNYSDKDTYRVIKGISWIKITNTKELMEDRYFKVPSFYLISNQFLENKVEAEEGGVLDFESPLYSRNLYIQQNIISGIQSGQNGAIFSEYTYNMANSLLGIDKIFENIFFNLASRSQGGAISLNYGKSEHRNTSVYDNVFLSCKSVVGGATYLTNNPRFFDNQFIGNYGKVGPAIYSWFTEVEIFSNNTFIVNIAEQGGIVVISKTISQKQFEPYYKNQTFAQNAVLNGKYKSFSTIPQTLTISLYEVAYDMNYISTIYPYPQTFSQILSQTNFAKKVNTYTSKNLSSLSIDFISGHSFPMGIKIDFIDEEGEVSSVLNGFSIDFSLTIGNVVRGSTLTIVNNSLSFYDDIVLVGDIGLSSHLYLKPSIHAKEILTISQILTNDHFKINFKDCEQGDIYSERLRMCQPCQNGTYTLDQPRDFGTKCKNCPLNADCYGKNILVPQEGFARYNLDSDIISQCQNPKACLGGKNLTSSEYNLLGECTNHSEGPLCSKCESGYAPDSEYICQKCQYGFTFFAFISVRIIASFGVIYWQIKSEFSSQQQIYDAYESQDRDQLGYVQGKFDEINIFKIVASYFQTRAIINMLEFDFIKVIIKYFSVLEFAIPVIFTEQNIDCFLQLYGLQTSKGAFFSFLIDIGSAISFCVLYFIGLYVKAYCSRNENKIQVAKEKFALAITITLYLRQPTILTEGLKLFLCKKVNENEYYLIKDVEMRCYSEEYYIWSWVIVGTFSALFGLAFPLFLYQKIKSISKRKKIRVEWHKAISQNSFILGGFKEEYYNWELVIMIRKSLMILVLIIWGENKLLSAVFILAILFIAWKYNSQCEPYKNQEIVQLESLQLVTLLWSIFMQIYASEVLLDDSSSKEVTYELFVFGYSVLGLIAYFLIKAGIMLWKLMKISRRVGQIASRLHRNSVSTSKTRKSLELEIDFSRTNKTENQML